MTDRQWGIFHPAPRVCRDRPVGIALYTVIGEGDTMQTRCWFLDEAVVLSVVKATLRLHYMVISWFARVVWDSWDRGACKKI
jgi:hypothetical protein